jgi:hypothetical protein
MVYFLLLYATLHNLNTEELARDRLDSKLIICISTIQVPYSILKGEKRMKALIKLI